MRSKNPEMMTEIKDYITHYSLQHNGNSPTMQQIGDALGINKSTAYRYIVEMQEKGMLVYDGKKAETVLSRKYNPFYTNAAIVGSIPCGSPEEEEEDIEEIVDLPTSIFGTGTLYILHASGDSMVDIGICSGDLVVVRKTSSANEGDVVVALDEDGQNTLKTLRFDKVLGRYYLHPENEKYRDLYPEEISVQGVATHVIKNLTEPYRLPKST